MQLVEVPVLYLFAHIGTVALFEADERHSLGFLERFLVLVLSDFLLVYHFSENKLASFLVVLRMNQRVESARVLGNSGDSRALSYGAFVDVLSEVEVCCGLNALAVVAVVNDVEVGFKDFVLGVLGLELERLYNLADFTRKANLVVVGDVLD